KVYICPSDYSGINSGGQSAGWNVNSYNANGQVFYGMYPDLNNTFTDGTGETVMYIEHLALCRNPAGGNSATDGRCVWPATNLTTGDFTAYWPKENDTNNIPLRNLPATSFAIQYPTAKLPDPASGGVLSWKRPQAVPTMGPTGTCDPLTSSSGHPGGVIV